MNTVKAVTRRRDGVTNQIQEMKTVNGMVVSLNEQYNIDSTKKTNQKSKNSRKKKY